MIMPELTFAIDVTKNCNLRCRHCYNSSGEIFCRKELDDDQLKDAVKQISEIEPMSVCLCGGEPLLRKNVVLQLIDILVNNNITTNLTTNGILMNREYAKDLKDHGIYNVQVSIDGDKEIHNWVRNSEIAYDGAINAIRILVNEGINVGVACLPTKKNHSMIPNIAQEMEELGVSLFRIQPMMALGRANTIMDWCLSPQEYTSLSIHLTKILKLKKMNLEWGDPTQHLFYLADGKPSKMLCINAFGDLLLSPYIPISFGNILNHRLRDYLNAGVLTKVRDSEQLKKIFTDVGYSLDTAMPANFPTLYQDEMFNMDCIEKSRSEEEKLMREWGYR